MALIERQAHFTQVDQWLTNLRSAASRLILFEGTAGSGRTSLIRASADRAEAHQVQAVTAHCSPLEQELPCGVLQQLFRSHRLPAWFRAEAGELLDNEPERAKISNRLAMAVLELADQQPVLLCVDDATYADGYSWQCLMRIVEVLGTAPMLLVATSLADRPPAAAPLPPLTHRINVDLLSRHGVGQLVGGQADPDACYAATGGNPLLLHALVDSDRAFADAYFACLQRFGEDAVQLAQTIALHDSVLSPSELAAFTNTDSSASQLVLRALNRAGMLKGTSFRHDAARTRVLAEIPHTERPSLHLRAARALHQAGSPAPLVADQLLRAADADFSEMPQAVGVLLDASAQQLGENKISTAVSLLQLAKRKSRSGDAHHDHIVIRLAEADWQLSPASTARHLPELRSAVRRGTLGVADTASTIRHLLWSGHVEDARGLVDGLSGDGELTDRLLGWHPLVTGPAAETPGGQPIPPATLSRALLAGNLDKVPLLAHRVLTEATAIATEDTLLGLLALVYSDALSEARDWCDRVSARSLSPATRSVLAAARAEIACRTGDFPAAAKHAERALSSLSPRGWGVAVGLPLGTLVVAYTRMGRSQDADRCLAFNLPSATADTRYGLHHLYARGQNHLAEQRAHAALADFTECGERMQAWGLDLAGIAPWRLGAAQALLLLEEHDKARALVEEQLALAHTSELRVRGTALRMLAAVTEFPQRLRLLLRSMKILETSGDQYELALTLGDLGRAHGDLGDRRLARDVVQRAWRLAASCDAKPLHMELQPKTGTLEPVPHRAPGVFDSSGTLTKSQRRVAALAALGYTNREIAQKLCITPSTVEQHLTRVFRKLNVRNRSELPASLAADFSPLSRMVTAS